MKYVRRHRRVLATAAGFALLLIVGTMLSLWQARRAGQAEKEWALETALPEVERRLEKDEYTAAFKLVEQARPFIGDNARFRELSARAVSVISFETTPPGADVFIREYSDLDPKWEPIGKSPFKEVKGPQGVKRWKVTLPGYEMAEGALVAGSKEESFLAPHAGSSLGICKCPADKSRSTIGGRRYPHVRTVSMNGWFNSELMFQAPGIPAGGQGLEDHPEDQRDDQSWARPDTVVATGTVLLAYRWQRDSGSLDFYDLPGRTSTNLILTPFAFPAMAGAPAEDASPEFYGRVKELQSQFRQGKKPPRR